jgi:hypothetical protein
MSETKKTGASLALVLFLCLVLRLGFVLALEKHPPRVPTDGYIEIAENILAGQGFSPTPLRHWSFRTPGYPLFIAAVWGLVPTAARYVALELAQVGLSVITCGLLFLLADDVFGRRAAWIGAVLFAVSPSSIVFCALTVTESLHVFWIALAALIALKVFQSPHALTAVGLGLIWGLAGLTRPEATVLVPLLLLPVLGARHLGVPAKVKVCSAAALAKLAVMAPWVARNFLVFGGFVLHVPLGGDNLFRGTYPHPPMYGRGWHGTGPQMIHVNQSPEYRAITDPFWDPRFRSLQTKLVDADVVTRSERDTLEVDRRLAAAAWSHIRNYKLTQIRNILYHIYGMWGRPAAWDNALAAPIRLAWYASYLAFLGLFVLGVLVAWKSGQLGLVPLSWLILMAASVGLFLLFAAESRYQATSWVFLAMFSGLGLAAILPFPNREARAVAAPERPSEGEPGANPDDGSESAAAGILAEARSD